MITPKTERHPKRHRIQAAQLIEPSQHRLQELAQAGEAQRRLILGPRRAKHPDATSPRVGSDNVQQRGLTDSDIARQ
jgi:hypothetical protein